LGSGQFSGEQRWCGAQFGGTGGAFCRLAFCRDRGQREASFGGQLLRLAEAVKLRSRVCEIGTGVEVGGNPNEAV